MELASLASLANNMFRGYISHVYCHWKGLLPLAGYDSKQFVFNSLTKKHNISAPSYSSCLDGYGNEFPSIPHPFHFIWPGVATQQFPL